MSDSDYQKFLLGKAAAAGPDMKAVRLVLPNTQPATRAAVIAHILHCNALGIDVLLQPSMGDASYYPPKTAKRAGRHEGRYQLFDAFRLSDLDPLRFEAQIGLFLTEARAAKARIKAIELGNELNWADYNGDLPVYEVTGSQHTILTSATAWAGIGRDAVYDKVRAGILKYGSCLFRLSKALNEKYADMPAVLKVTAGLADIGPAWVESTRSAKITPSAFLLILEGRYPGQPVTATNYLNYINGRGIHLYPADITADVALTKRQISAIIDPIEDATANHTPFWITEWGYHRGKFGGNEDKRFRAHAAFVEAVNQLTFPVAYAFLYGFDAHQYECYLRATDSYLPTRAIFTGHH